VWRGWLDLVRLDGTARLEFDQQRAMVGYEHNTPLHIAVDGLDL